MFGVHKSPMLQPRSPHQHHHLSSSPTPTDQTLHVTGEFRVGSNVRVGPSPHHHSPPQGSCISPGGRKSTTPTTGRKTPNRVHFSDVPEVSTIGDMNGRSGIVLNDRSSSSSSSSSSSNRNYYVEEEEKVITKTVSNSQQLSPRLLSSSSSSYTSSNGVSNNRASPSFPARLSPQPHSPFRVYHSNGGNGGANERGETAVNQRPLSSPVIVVDLGNGRKIPQRAATTSSINHSNATSSSASSSSSASLLSSASAAAAASSRKSPVSIIPVHYDFSYNHNAPPLCVEVGEERVVDVRIKSTQRESAPLGYRLVDHTRHVRRKKVTGEKAED